MEGAANAEPYIRLWEGIGLGLAEWLRLCGHFLHSFLVIRDQKGPSAILTIVSFDDILQRALANPASLVSAAVALILFPFAVVNYLKGKKAIFVLWSSEQFLESSKSLTPRIQVTYEDKTVPELWVTTIVLESAGTGSIEVKDFERPLKLRLPGASILGPAQIFSHPAELAIDHVALLDGFEIQPLLLNSKDCFVLRIFTDSEVKEVNLTCRVSGVRRPNVVKESPRSTSWFFRVTILIMVPLLFWTMYKSVGESRFRSEFDERMMAASDPVLRADWVRYQYPFGAPSFIVIFVMIAIMLVAPWFRAREGVEPRLRKLVRNEKDSETIC